MNVMLCRYVRLAKKLEPHCAAVLVDVKQLITTPVRKEQVSLILPMVKRLAEYALVWYFARMCTEGGTISDLLLKAQR